MTELIITVGVALSVSFCCSLLEAVFYSVPLRQIEAKAQSGGLAWKVFRDMRRNVDRPIAAILSLNTIANTAGAAFAGSAAAVVFGHGWLPYFSAGLTLSILIFSEILPKTLGMVYGRQLVSYISYPLRGLVWAMTPVTSLLGLFTRVISRQKMQEVITTSELRAMVRLGLESGSITTYQEKAIQRMLTLHQRVVKEVMTPRTVIYSLKATLSLEEAKRAFTRWEHSRFPVYDRNTEDVVGIVLAKDLLLDTSPDPKGKKLLDIMRPVHFIAETARLNHVLREFLDRREHLFVVLDEYGGLSGLISLEDIMEEILGTEIVDEHDQVIDTQALARERRKGLFRRFP